MNFNYLFPNMAIITREKLTGLGVHAGVMQADGTVFHTTQERGPHVVSFHEFAAGKTVRIDRTIPPSEHHAVRLRIISELINRTPYHLLENNCEIVANRVAGKPAMSPQVLFWLAAGLLGGFALAASA